MEDLLGLFFVLLNGINCDVEFSEDDYECMVYNLYCLYKGMIVSDVRIVFLEIVYSFFFYGMLLYYGVMDKNSNLVMLVVCSSGVFVFDVDNFGLLGNVIENFLWYEIVFLVY